MNGGSREFLATMSHELRTPLNAILGFSELMRAEVHGPLHVRYRAYLDDIHASGTLLLDAVEAVLEVCRIEAEASAGKGRAESFGAIAAALRSIAWRAAAGVEGMELLTARSDEPLFTRTLKEARQEAELVGAAHDLILTLAPHEAAVRAMLAGPGKLA